ncbi:MAG: YARHG domain-containing protein [Hyphomicrobiaceae bacterium]
MTKSRFIKGPRRAATTAILMAAAGLGIGAGLVGPTAAQAQYAHLSCGQLWYQRNAIFAQYGYCFKTPQARAAFGPRCYPPYGQLPPHAQRQVNAIVYWEQRKGCN